MKQLSGAIQEALLVLLLWHDDADGGVVVRHMVPVNAYDAYLKEIAQAALNYVDKYGRAPGEHTIDLFDEIKLRFPEDAKIYDRVLDSLLETKDASSFNPEYTIAQASAFVRFQGMKRAIATAIDALKREDESGLREAEVALEKARNLKPEGFDAAIRLNDPKILDEVFAANQESMLTGIAPLDKYDLGPARSTLHVFVAPPSRGKSWWLLNLGKYALLNRKRVLHVTCEMSRGKIASRYMQCLYSVTKRKEQTVKVMQVKENGKEVDWRERLIKERRALEDKDIRPYLTSRLAKLEHRPPLMVAQFPSGELTVKELETYLDWLEASGFIPDLLIVDYADEMAVDMNNYRHSLNAIYRGLRAIAMKRNIAVATASQTNRSGDDVKLITRKVIGEDWRKIAVADTIITCTQTRFEAQLGLARLYVDKSRDEHLPYRLFLISQAFAVGQFCMSAVPLKSQRAYDRMIEEEEQHHANTKQEDID